MTELARLSKPRDLVSHWFAVRHGDFLTIHNRMAVSAICNDLLKAGLQSCMFVQLLSRLTMRLKSLQNIAFIRHNDLPEGIAKASIFFQLIHDSTIMCLKTCSPFLCLSSRTEKISKTPG